MPTTTISPTPLHQSAYNPDDAPTVVGGAGAWGDADDGTYSETWYDEDGSGLNDGTWGQLPPVAGGSASLTSVALDLRTSILNVGTPPNSNIRVILVHANAGFTDPTADQDFDFIGEFTNHPGGFPFEIGLPSAGVVHAFGPGATEYAFWPSANLGSVLTAWNAGTLGVLAARSLTDVGGVGNGDFACRVHKLGIVFDYVPAVPPVVTVAPPLRLHPRSDGMGMSAARRQVPPPRSTQWSLRRGPGSHH